MKSIERLSASFVIAAALAAPWIAGGRTDLKWVEGLAVLPAVACVLLLGVRRMEGQWLEVPTPAAILAIALLGCLGFWALRPEPPFATAYAAEHWRFMESWNPASLLQLPRLVRFFFLGSVLLGFFAAIDLGRWEGFRRCLCGAIGIDGLATTGYSLGERWLHWPSPSWVLTSEGRDAYTATFFHHSTSAAAFDLAWPLLIFGGCLGLHRILRAVCAVVALGMGVAGLVLWEADSAYQIAGGLVAAALAWKYAIAVGRFRPWLVLAGIGLVLGVVFAWQVASVIKLRTHYPDGWVNARVTEGQAPVRDALVRTRALTRGDHLVSSSAPPRPVAWLAAWRMARDYPMMGLGPGAWVRKAILYSNEPIMNTFFQHRQFAHNDLYQTAAEWGVLPAIAWLLLWTGALYGAVRRSLPDPTEEMGLVLALLGMALHATMHFPLQVPALQLWVALLLGLGWSARQRSRLV